MLYYTELHAHTSEVSPCSHLTAAEVAERYLCAGYHTVVVTNHYCDYVMDPAGSSWEERLAHFVSGYQSMKHAVGDRLHVLLGMELRFTENSNDYLIFGFDEDFLRTHPDLHRMNLKSFSALARENGILVVQAHPFRNGMKIMNPALLDGIEVFNGHPGHDSRNRIALDWCRRYHKIPTSGSDFHDASSVEAGGIVTDEPICTMKQLADVLRSGRYTLRCTGPAAKLDGMTDFDANHL